MAEGGKKEPSLSKRRAIYFFLWVGIRRLQREEGGERRKFDSKRRGGGRERGSYHAKSKTLATFHESKIAK